MKYALLIFGEETPEAAAPEPGTAAFQEYLQPWVTYTAELQEAGVFVGGEALELSTTATRVQLRDGKRIVQDGPAFDAKEHLGGFYIVDVPTLDDALHWAEKCPGAAFGTMEVRPVPNFGEA